MITNAIITMNRASTIAYSLSSEKAPQIPAKIAVAPMMIHMMFVTSYLNDSHIDVAGGSGFILTPNTAFLRSRSALSPTIPVALSETIALRIPSA